MVAVEWGIILAEFVPLFFQVSVVSTVDTSHDDMIVSNLYLKIEEDLLPVHILDIYDIYKDIYDIWW